jgi:Piwi domain
VKAFTLPPVQFAFSGANCGPDKLRGLTAYGPFRPVPMEHPRFGFFFPADRRDDANKLYLALKNGIGLFRGVENTFRFSLGKQQVFPVPVAGVELGARADHSKNARAYASAIMSWNGSMVQGRPDMFFVLHPKTGESDSSTPYYECKARLLSDGILSQNVTLDLLANRAQFEWSAANIALGAFVKLGGVPWVVRGEELDQDLIIGLGRAYVFDPKTRQNKGYMAFTTCFSARGPLRFVSLAEFAQTRDQYLDSLRKVVRDALSKADNIGSKVTTLTIHAPKEMQREEMQIIRAAVSSHVKQSVVEIVVVKVTDESSFFALDERFQDGVPRRGTAIQVSDRDLMLYTEGREEKETWTNRMPVALRVTPSGPQLPEAKALSVLRQINDLSQVNWRGFNARSKPISVYYGSLIARLLSHVPPDMATALYSQDALRILEERMWFL